MQKQNTPLSTPKASLPKGTSIGISFKKLSLSQIDGYLKFVLFLALIGMIYIGNAYRAENHIRHYESLKKEVKKLKSDYIQKKANLSAATRYSKVAGMMEAQGLQKLSTPPYKLMKEEEK